MGARLRSLRRDRGLGDRELAAMLGVEVLAWTAVEQGDVDASVPFLWRAAELLGTTLSELVAGLQ